MLYLKKATKLGYKSAVVRTPDTDIFVILLFHAMTIGLTIFFDNGSGKHRQIVNVSQMAESMGADKCKIVLGLHAYTGKNVISSFKRKGKIGPLKKLQRHPIHHEAVRYLSYYLCNPLTITASNYFCLAIHIILLISFQRTWGWMVCKVRNDW